MSRRSPVDKQREIDWSAAAVSDDATMLPLSGTASKQWSERFETVVTLLGRGNSPAWDEIGLSKKAIKVTGLQPGAEDDLRHFLESVVVQVNTELSDQPDPQAGEQAAESEDPQAKREAEITDRLRSFSEQADGKASE